MIRTFLITLALLICSTQAYAQTVVASGPIRARAIISETDITLLAKTITGAIEDAAFVIGMEARVNLYPGRPIRFSDIGPPAILERNQFVTMVYNTGALAITVEGRVLERGGVGERVRVMNMDSRVTVIGRVMENGTVEVGL